MAETPLMMGAVAYAPQVVRIWESFKAYFASQGMPFDYCQGVRSAGAAAADGSVAGRRVCRRSISHHWTQ